MTHMAVNSSTDFVKLHHFTHNVKKSFGENTPDPKCRSG